jgi:spore coat protein U-like protein
MATAGRRVGGRQRACAVAFLAAGLLAPLGAASAGTTTGSFTVTALVNSNCLVTALPLNFGTYTPTAGPLKVNTTINVNCTLGTKFTVQLNAGTTGGTSFAQRLLRNTTAGDPDTLQYNLYTISSYGSIWGDGTSGTATVTGFGAGVLTSVPETVYGVLVDSAANQNASAGTYTDTITVTVTF